MAVGRSIAQLGKQYRAGRSRDEDEHIQALLTLQKDPASTLDILRVISAVFGANRRPQVEVPPLSGRYPLEGMAFGEMVEGMRSARFILENAVKALPVNRSPKIPASVIVAEVESLRDGSMTVIDEQTLSHLAHDLHTLVEFVMMLVENGDPKAFENSGLAKRIDSGKHKPRSTLEFMRFLYTYFEGRS
jgi:hypothetical protein